MTVGQVERVTVGSWSERLRAAEQSGRWDSLEVDALVSLLLPDSLDDELVALGQEADGRLVVAACREWTPAEQAQLASHVGLAVQVISISVADFQQLRAGPRLLPRVSPGDTLGQMVTQAAAIGGTDLHLAVGAPPWVRLRGQLVGLDGWERPLSAQATQELARHLAGSKLPDADWDGDLDLAVDVVGQRLRCSIYRQRGQIALAVRILPGRVPALEELHLPPQVARICELERGLVLVAGTTGSGKTTTLAAVIDRIAADRACHILTIEDPVEYLLPNQQARVTQREIGSDTTSFARALRAALRQDPDVILVGEMRDAETISVALQAAETGHLVLSTVHAGDAGSVIDRIVSSFAPETQAQVRVQLANTLAWVVIQQLVPSLDPPGSRRPVCEIMTSTNSVRAHIREGKTQALHSDLQTGRQVGMITFDDHLTQLVNMGAVDPRVAARVRRDRTGNEDRS